MSPQYAYQLRKYAEGKCIRCGNQLAVVALYCEACRRKRNVYQREWNRKRLGLKSRYLRAESYEYGAAPGETHE